jgi:hypothetical protein
MVAAAVELGEDAAKPENRVVVGWLAGKRSPRAGMDEVHGEDIFRMLLGPASYAALVVESGWTEDAWASSVERSIEEEIFDRAADRARS